jgi:phage repressor protein C with HTH and peptisase S24 domain
MNTLADRIKSERKSKKLTQEMLGKAVGVGKSSVSQWESGLTKNMDGTNMIMAAKALGVNPNWLATGQGDKHPNPRQLESNAHATYQLGAFTAVPIVGIAQLGDNGHWCELEYPVGYGDGHISYPTRDRNAYALRCVGDSMKPRIRDGEFVIVEPNSEAQPGDEVLVKAVDGRVMVKTLLYERDGKVHLLSVNEAHPPQALERTAIALIHPIAAIVKTALWVKDG